MHPALVAPAVCVNSQIYHNRWIELHRDNTLQAIDKGIVSLKCLSERVANYKGTRKKDALDDLEWNAFSVTRLLPKALVFTSGTEIALPFKPAPILSMATAQYLVRFDSRARSAIFRGCALGVKLIDQEVNDPHLTEQDTGYFLWAVPRLIRHLIYEANFWDEAMFAKFSVV